jgi:hypothetical protein
MKKANYHNKSIIHHDEDSFHQQMDLNLRTKLVKVIHLEYSFVWS